jgi:hypothetical protein
MAGKYIMLIGEDTKWKYKYVRWEAEVAIEKGCTVIGVNLNGMRVLHSERCPKIIRDIGAMFVPFRARIIAHALQNYIMGENGWFYYPDSVYRSLGYQV